VVGGLLLSGIGHPSRWSIARRRGIEVVGEQVIVLVVKLSARRLANARLVRVVNNHAADIVHVEHLAGGLITARHRRRPSDRAGCRRRSVVVASMQRASRIVDWVTVLLVLQLLVETTVGMVPGEQQL